MTVHVLAVQDDPATSNLLNSLPPESGYRITTLADPRAVSPFLHKTAVDLVLLDVALPYMDGFALCAKLRSEYPNIPIIFLTERDTLRDKVMGFSQGADDYIGKPFDPTELLVRIRAVLHRYRSVGDNDRKIVITVGDSSLDIGKLEFVAPERRPVLLTPTEMKLLACLMRNADMVVSRTTLIACTHGDYSPEGSNRTDVYIRRLRKKIEANPMNPSLIHTIRGVGYIFRSIRRHVQSTG